MKRSDMIPMVGITMYLSIICLILALCTAFAEPRTNTTRWAGIALLVAGLFFAGLTAAKWREKTDFRL